MRIDRFRAGAPSRFQKYARSGQTEPAGNPVVGLPADYTPATKIVGGGAPLFRAWPQKGPFETGQTQRAPKASECSAPASRHFRVGARAIPWRRLVTQRSGDP